MTAPIFVIGNPRSGTTLLRLLLAAHGELVVPPECGFVLWLLPRFGTWDAHSSQQPERVAEFLEALQVCRKFDSWALPLDQVADSIARRQPANYAALADAVYWAYAAEFKPHARRWGDKNNFHTRHVSDLHAIYPTCQFIHIVRDVRDVACSYRELQCLKTASPYRPHLPAEPELIGAEWSANIAAAEQALTRLPHHRVHRLRYEDLVESPELILRDVCEFLQLPFDPAMSEYYQLNLEPEATLDWKRRTLEPVSAVQVGRFRTELTAGEIATLTNGCRPWLERFRYPLD